MGSLLRLISALDEKEIYEIRLRLNLPVTVIGARGIKKLKLDSGNFYFVQKNDIERVVSVASNFAVYSVMDELMNGYLSYDGGIRIGASGDGVTEKGKLIAIKNISSLMIRIPHECKGCGVAIKREMDKRKAQTLLVLSPPACGKTTMLRDLARLYSKEVQTLIIDERCELTGQTSGNGKLDVGECDIVTRVPKILAYENSIRAMSPQLIVTDELFRQEEINAVLDIMRCGVRVFASVHAQSEVSLCGAFMALKDAFDAILTLTDIPKVGTVKSLVVKEEIC